MSHQRTNSEIEGKTRVSFGFRGVFMKIAFILITLIFLIQPFNVSADKNQQHPIDKMEAECLKKDNSTAWMTTCAGKAYDAWDKELNRIYSALIKDLSPDEKEILKTAQKKWLEYRDNEFKLIDAVYAKLQGTMYITLRVNERTEIVKQRALNLNNYIDLLH
jgi:uncharacterized protein YecT (DUF1311 family)